MLVGGGWSGLGGNWVVIRYLSMEGTLRSTHRGWEDGSYGLAAPVFGVPHRERDGLLHTAPTTTIITVGIVGIVGVVVRVRAVGSQPLDVCDKQNTPSVHLLIRRLKTKKNSQTGRPMERYSATAGSTPCGLGLITPGSV